LPTFAVRQGQVYTTVHHSDGADPHPWYEVRGDRLYPTEHHPQKASPSRPWYAIQGTHVFADEGHPHGAQAKAWFELRESGGAMGGIGHG
jgi:hypothetical protein